MIVYMINGKTPSVKAAIDYVCDEKKTAKNFNEIMVEYENNPDLKEEMTLEEYYLSCEDNINRALNYIANEDKIGGYISGYLCDPEFAEEQFKRTKQINLARVGKELKDDNGNYFYHIIQSFPEEIEISDDEVHQCGIELVERLGLYQAVITSHIHPVVDEEGEVHGKCKHNHIVMNSHIYHELIDPAYPHKMKYHDCKETYAQLQLINDQIAIEHGLPIIINQDKNRTYSWFENEETNRGKSWKERVRVDINNAMKVSTNFETYTEAILAAGYKFRLGKSKTHGEYITYTSPDGVHRVRDYILGRGYTKLELETYWDIKKNINQDLLNNRKGQENKIDTLVNRYNEPLYIKFEKRTSHKRKERLKERNLNIKNSYTNYFPLNIGKRTVSNAELTYFEPLNTYEIVNDQHQVIAQVNGDEVLEYLNLLYERRRIQAIENAERQKEQQKKEYYGARGFINSVTKSPYKIRLWDNNGRKRSMLELIIILAIVTIHNENEKWEPAKNTAQPQELKMRPIYAQKDWKIQNMIDTIKVAREENIQDQSELQKRLDKVGKETSKNKAEMRRLTTAKNKMEVLYDAIETFNEVRKICEQISALHDGPKKSQLQEKHASEIADYKSSKAVMYRFNVTSDEEIKDFLERYTQIQNKLTTVKEQLDQNKEEYRRLSKLKYNLELAQNKQYCYGPEYIEPEQEPEQEKEESQEKQNEK